MTKCTLFPASARHHTLGVITWVFSCRQGFGDGKFLSGIWMRDEAKIMGVKDLWEQDGYYNITELTQTFWAAATTWPHAFFLPTVIFQSTKLPTFYKRCQGHVVGWLWYALGNLRLVPYNSPEHSKQPLHVDHVHFTFQLRYFKAHKLRHSATVTKATLLVFAIHKIRFLTWFVLVDSVQFYCSSPWSRIWMHDVQLTIDEKEIVIAISIIIRICNLPDLFASLDDVVAIAFAVPLCVCKTSEWNIVFKYVGGSWCWCIGWREREHRLSQWHYTSTLVALHL